MPELLAVGETMLALTPLDGGIDVAASYRAAIAGGESNVAVHVAAHGYSAGWASRVGADAVGRRLVAELEERGVDCSLVRVDADAPTGLMLKDPCAEGTTVLYYRAGSAASRMLPGTVPATAVAEARVVHVTGVTPALSTGCGAMIDSLFAEAAAADTLVSFDVNFRPALWKERSACEVLASYARRADLCFVGRDEAEALWGTHSPHDIRAHLPEPTVLVVKDGALGATAFERDEPAVFEPALHVDVVEPVGAGDAFAGGYLAGLLGGKPAEECLRLGHAAAARVLVTVEDLPPLEETAR
ncbi:sugar kinase [Agromyces sp. NPDC058104]|uniref:sugar kinase n=1 Tax=Agromyces sp. NPDC058104 TaxID=3346342 RepID=UPI0036DA2A88